MRGRSPNISFDTNISKLSIYFNSLCIEYKVTVQDVVKASNKVSDDWGISGYTIPKFNPYLDKPPGFKITNSRTRDLMNELIKNKDYPGPNKYETAGSMLLKQKISIYKLPRVTTFAEEQKKVAKLPAPGQYHQELKKKPLGAFKLKEDRIGFVDQARFDGFATPSHYETPRIVILTLLFNI